MKALRTRVSEISLTDHSLVNVIVHKKAIVDSDDMIDVFLAVKKMANDLPVSVLIDTRANAAITRRAWNMIEKSGTPARHKAKAIIVRSVISSRFANFLSLMKNNKYPVKQFTSELGARNWLANFEKE
ncbi:MAG: hypothetical protein JNL60_19830 [Bacteroidia bacterium]|nr:hypothetical protein [Bacteroidia bacterium]